MKRIIEHGNARCRYNDERKEVSVHAVPHIVSIKQRISAARTFHVCLISRRLASRDDAR